MEYEPPLPGNPGGVLIDVEIRKIENASEEAKLKGKMYAAFGVAFTVGSILASLVERQNGLPGSTWDFLPVGFLVSGMIAGAESIIKWGFEAEYKKDTANDMRARYASLLVPDSAKKR